MKEILLVTLNHRVTPLEVREGVAFGRAEAADALVVGDLMVAAASDFGMTSSSSAPLPE